LEAFRPERHLSDQQVEVGCYLLSLDPVDVVQQCCLAMHELLRQIPLEEFLSSKYDDSVLCPHLVELKQLKDRVSPPPPFLSSYPPSLLPPALSLCS
jgi:hypothetical protein